VSLIDKLIHAPTQEAIAKAVAAQRELFNNSLFLFAKCCLGYQDLTWRTHGPVCMALEAATTRKLIVMPRGTFKSSLVSVAYPIWCLNRNPNLRVLLDSEIYSNSKNFLREIKGHLQSERLTRVFGQYGPTEVWNEGEVTIKQRTLIKKEASITCTGIGAEKTGQHYDLVLMDDMNSPKNSNTPEGCQKVVDHYKYMNAILDPGGTLAIVGTRYSAADLIGVVWENEVWQSEEDLNGH